jgi:hypothetical protein
VWYVVFLKTLITRGNAGCPPCYFIEVDNDNRAEFMKYTFHMHKFIFIHAYIW